MWRVLGAILIAGLAPAPALAQPFPTQCSGIVQELKMRPPAYGQKARAERIWNSYLNMCEKEWAGQVAAEDVDALATVINPQVFK